MTVRFHIRSKSKNASIHVSASFPGNIKYRKKTGFVVDAKHWNVKKQLPDTSTVANKNLGFELVKLRNRIVESYNELVSQDLRINKEWFENLINGTESGETVVWATRYLIENAERIKGRKGRGLSRGRVRIYGVFERKLKDYSPDWKVSNVSPESVERFRSWLSEKGYSQNYVESFVSRLKAVCNFSNLPLHPDFDRIKVHQTPKSEIRILTDGEQGRISELRLEGELETARRWLLLGCQLGQRGGDLLKMTEYRTFNGIRIIEVDQEKTGKKVAVPVNDRAWKILRAGFPEPLPLYKFNELVKRVCYRAKIERHGEISSHIMRRSFATNYYGKIPTPILMNITGHSRESTFLAYVGKTSLDNAREAMEWFKKLGDL